MPVASIELVWTRERLSKLFEVIFGMVFDVLPFFVVGVHRGSWSKTWKSKVQPFCTHWLA